jgi:formimidoylglutamate deiminase
MKSWSLEYAWLGGRFSADVELTVDDAGTIAAVTPGKADSSAERVAGIALPGMSNVHSHAFQRGLVGLTEYRTAEHDSFWTWRELMYHFLRWLTPDDCYALARQLYGEMLVAGYTSVGEFHYLHNDVNGGPYQDRAAMAEALIAAAADAGIRLCLMPALYQRGGFGRPVEHGQRRFVLTLDECLDLVTLLRKRHASDRNLEFGFAVHSLRAVDWPVARQAVQAIDAAWPGRPLHMHAAEQEREVADCLAVHGRRPVELALADLGVDRRWCLIHATHIDPAECAALARSGAVVGLCPTTEANLGDGVFPVESFARGGGQWTIGTDSHVGVDPRGELRLIEYAQRLTRRQRVVLGSEETSCGQYLCQAAWSGGGQALGLPIGRISVGARADLVVLDLSDPNLAALPSSRWLDSFVFAGIGNSVRDTMVGGEWMVRDRVHLRAGDARRAYARTLSRILERL